MNDKKLKKYERIYRDIKIQIDNDIYKIGEQLPTEVELMEKYEVSRITVQKAINNLKKNGYVERTSGKGTFVTKTPKADIEFKNRFVTVVIVFDTQDALETISGIESTLSNQGFGISLGISRGDAQKEKEIIKSAIEKKSSGLIVYAIDGQNNIDIFDDLIVTEYPLVFIDKPPFSIDCSLVSSDSFIGGYKVAKHFIEKGHKRFAFIGYEMSEIQTIERRYEGFIFGLKKNNLRKDSCLVIDYEKFFDSVESVFFTPLRPTAVFCANDIIAFSVIKSLKNIGLRVPEDISVVGFDDNVASFAFIPSLTTVKQDYFQIGATAGKIILDKIINKQKINQQIFIPTTFIERDSVNSIE